ncbi:MAG: hypothetical protein KBT39_06775 [Bacteroidales bacterium]|nr:hypothetical protein [Bacteroidales bacterium]
MTTRQNELKVVNTKVTEWCHKRLQNICAKTGITLYNMLGMMCDTIVRYMDDKTNLSPTMERAMSVFEHMEGWKDAFNLADPGETFEVQEAIYFVGNEQHKGVRAVMIDKPFMGVWNQTVNVQKIFESVVCKMFPERYKKLRLLAIQWGCNSQLDALDRLLDNELQGMDNAAIREEFEDCDRSDYGTKPTDHRYKRKHHKSVDTIKFKKEDVPDLPELFPEDDLPFDNRNDEPKDFRPFGSEW